jgi:predicted TPR repeat methyltransferase
MFIVSAIKVIGNLDRNDFSKIPIGLNTPVTTISIETVARAMIGVDMSSLQKMHGKAISKEFFHRAKRALKRRLHLK